MRAPRALTFAAFASLAAAAGAQAPSDGAGVAGTWTVRTIRSTRRTPVLDRLEEQLAQIESVFRRAAPLNPPMGYSVLETRSVHQADPSKMARGQISMILIRHEVAADGSVDVSGRGEGLPIVVTVNDIGVTWEKTDLRDAQGQIYTPATRAEYRRFPTYHDEVFLTRRGVPTTVPVPRERAIRAAMLLLSEVPAAQAALQRELEGLSATERREPSALDVAAYVGYGLQQEVARPVIPPAADTGHNTPREKTVLALVVPNPVFYDRSRPGDVQVLSVSIPCVGESRSPWCAQYPGVFERIRDSIDWQALLQLMR